MSYIVSAIENIKEFFNIENSWETLRKNNGYSLFSSHSWYKCVISSRKIEIKPYIVIAKDECGSIKGILPLQKDKRFKITGLKSIINSDTHCYEAIIDKRDPYNIVLSIFNYLKNNKRINYIEMSPVSEKHLPLIDFSDKKKFCFINLVKESPYIDSNQPFQVLIKNRSKKSRKRLRNMVNRYNRIDDHSVENITSVNEEHYKDIIKISNGSWKGYAGSAIGSNESTKLFFSLLLQTPSIKKWLNVWFLKINGIRAAMEFHLRENEVEYALRGDYLTEFNDYSPGHYLDYCIVKYLCEKDDVSVYDMCGDKYDYKMSWCPLTQKFNRIIWIFNPILRLTYKTKILISNCLNNTYRK